MKKKVKLLPTAASTISLQSQHIILFQQILTHFMSMFHFHTP